MENKDIKRYLIEITRSESSDKEIKSDTLSCEIITGIESGGITPFEKALLSVGVGETTVLQINHQERQLYFSCFYPTVSHFFVQNHLSQPVVLQAKVKKIEDPTNKEIVQAMAQSLSHGCGGGSCGCGC